MLEGVLRDRSEGISEEGPRRGKGRVGMARVEPLEAGTRSRGWQGPIGGVGEGGEQRQMVSVGRRWHLAMRDRLGWSHSNFLQQWKDTGRQVGLAGVSRRWDVREHLHPLVCVWVGRGTRWGQPLPRAGSGHQGVRRRSGPG